MAVHILIVPGPLGAVAHPLKDVLFKPVGKWFNWLMLLSLNYCIVGFYELGLYLLYYAEEDAIISALPFV